ncbi:MAG: hypothetical protein ACK5XN_27440 [Bacteroidota bacterium]|jgi:hypothetical protein
MKNFILLVLAAQWAFTSVYGQATLTDNDKAEILTVIEQETRCYFSNNYDCWQECWSQNPQSSGFVAAGGAVYERSSWPVMSKEYQNDMRNRIAPDPSSVRRENPSFIVLGEGAVICHFDAYNIKEKECTYSKEIRAMQKVAGRWRISLMTALFDATKKCGE